MGRGYGGGTSGPVPPSEPGQPAGRLGTRPLPGPSSARPAGRPQDPFEAAVLGTRRAAPRPGGLHGCGAITQAQVWAQSGRGGGLAGKARAAALACAARVGPGLVLHRGPPRRPPLGVWGWPGPAGAPRTPESPAQGRGAGAGSGQEAAAASSPQPGAGRWVGCGPRWPDVRLGRVARCRLER